MSMTFDQVSTTNLARAILWHPRGLNEWSEADWSNAMAGEAGEVCNAVKKLRRIQCGLQQAKGPRTLDEARGEISKEIGDTYLYLDLLAARLGLRIEDCIRETFNRVSEREGFPQRLEVQHAVVGNAVLSDWPTGITPIDGYQKPLGVGGRPSAYVDGDTGLMWGPTLGELTKADADARVRDFRLFDYADWRLPTRKELFSLVVDGRCDPCCDPAIVDMKPEGYWASSPVPGDEDYCFVVSFYHGYVYYDLRVYLRWVRPVRSLALPSGRS
ncbi:MAG: DUF1566 domain-containing protein [Sinimarinibacterium flocculans]|uniref:Lcl domain-containing protein n=1 Tax=Sinimarinibacterium flocculans TaxID=985250 RepID=UPI003C64179D